MKYTFEEFLQEKHTEENPTILDDDLSDAFNDWLTEIDVDQLIKYGNMYGEKLLTIANKN